MSDISALLCSLRRTDWWLSTYRRSCVAHSSRTSSGKRPWCRYRLSAVPPAVGHPLEHDRRTVAGSRLRCGRSVLRWIDQPAVVQSNGTTAGRSLSQRSTAWTHNRQALESSTVRVAVTGRLRQPHSCCRYSAIAADSVSRCVVSGSESSRSRTPVARDDETRRWSNDAGTAYSCAY